MPRVSDEEVCKVIVANENWRARGHADEGVLDLALDLADLRAQKAKDDAEHAELVKALRHLSAMADTLSPQEVINVVANALGVDRHQYAGRCGAEDSLVMATNREAALEADYAAVVRALHGQLVCYEGGTNFTVMSCDCTAHSQTWVVGNPEQHRPSCPLATPRALSVKEDG